MGVSALEGGVALQFNAMLLPLLLLLVSQLLPAEALPSNSLPKSRIPSPPSRDARIGIVGAGPAGLHMAYLLHSLGFKDLVVLEASHRVGGRSVSLPDSEAPEVTHELGTCYVNRDYKDLWLMTERIGHQLYKVILPKAVMRDGDQQLTLDRFLSDRVLQLDPGDWQRNVTVKTRIVEAAARYREIRAKIFPDDQPSYLEFPMTQPSRDVLALVNCSLAKFLVDNGLMALEPLFLVGMTAMGYGSVSDTSALYGLMWLSPAYLEDLTVPRELSQLAVLRGGFQSIWTTVHNHLKGGVKFRLNSSVSRVTRSRWAVHVQLADGSSEDLDWLVWTPPVHRTAGAFVQLSPAEAAAFAGLRARKFRARLVRLAGNGSVDSRLAADPVAYYLDALEGHLGLNNLLAVRNSAKVLGSQSVQRTLVAYYLSSYGDGSGYSSGDDGSGDSQLLDDSETLADITFDYMPRYSVPDMAEGALWRALSPEVQGAQRTWFAGHSLVFDSVRSVMKYNKMLLLAAYPEWAARLAEI